MQTLLPRRVDHILTNPRQVRANRRLLCWRDTTFEDDFQILDANGDPVRLGLNSSTLWWDFLAEVRTAPVQAGGLLLATMAIAVTDVLAGTGTYRLLPANTRGITFDTAYWELDVTNTAHPDFDVGFKAAPFWGDFHFGGHYAGVAS